MTGLEEAGGAIETVPLLLLLEEEGAAETVEVGAVAVAMAEVVTVVATTVEVGAVAVAMAEVVAVVAAVVAAAAELEEAASELPARTSWQNFSVAGRTSSEQGKCHVSISKSKKDVEDENVLSATVAPHLEMTQEVAVLTRESLFSQRHW